MGQTFSSNNRECFGFGKEMTKDAEEEEVEGQQEGIVVTEKVSWNGGDARAEDS
jgi:hypothetical protein